MGAVALIFQVALDSAAIADPSAMACGFPPASVGEPAIQIEIAQNETISTLPGTLGVVMRLSTGASIAGQLQAAPFRETGGILIAASPASQVYYTLSLHPDGVAALNIRDMRNRTQIREVTRSGTCQAHEEFMHLVKHH